MATASQTDELCRVTVRMRRDGPKLYVEATGKISAGQPCVVIVRNRSAMGEFSRIQARSIATRMRKLWRLVSVEPIINPRQQ